MRKAPKRAAGDAVLADAAAADVIEFRQDDDGVDAARSNELLTGGGSFDEPAPRAPRKKKTVSSDKKELERLSREAARRGLVYLSRVPPFMQPLKLRQMMSQHGEVLRIYMAPEDAAVRQKRKKGGGNRSINFTEAWVEFADKRVAQDVAIMLNGYAVGGKRFSPHHSDLWAIKYLPRFKWEHLSEEIAYEKAVREQKLAAEVSAANRERDFYLAKVDQSKAMAAMAGRKRAKNDATVGLAGPAAADAGGAAAAPRPPRVVRQRSAFSGANDGPGAGGAPARTLPKNLLGMLFGGPGAQSD